MQGRCTRGEGTRRAGPRVLACCRGAALGKARARGHVVTGTRGRMKELVFQGFSAPWQGRGPWRGRHACGDARHRKGRVRARRVKLLPTSGERKGGPSQTRIRARGLGLLGAMGRTGRKGEDRRVCIVLWGLAGPRHQHGRQRKLNDGERSCVVGLGHAAATQVTTASILRQWSTVPSENVEIKLRLHSISNVM